MITIIIEEKENHVTFRCCFSSRRSRVDDGSGDSDWRSFCRPREINVGAVGELSCVSLLPSLKFLFINDKDGVGKGVCLRRVFILNIVAFV
jgi:hypothetical protein